MDGIDRILSLAQQGRRLRERGQATMFDLWGESVATPLPELELRGTEVSVREKSSWERELLGASLSEQPFGSVAKKLPPEVDTFCGQIDEEMVGQMVVTAGQVISVRQLFTKNGRPFVSAVLGDMDGSLEVTAWTEVYEPSKGLWVEGNNLIVKGVVKVRGGRVQLVCHSVIPYQTVAALTRNLFLNIAQSDDPQSDIARLREVFETLSEFPGEDSVHLAIIDDGGVTKLDVPHITTGYCPELHQRLVNLVGEQGLIVED
jgi:DNA polymerase III alpha subunit